MESIRMSLVRWNGCDLRVDERVQRGGTDANQGFRWNGCRLKGLARWN